MKHNIVDGIRLSTALAGIVLAFTGFAHAGAGGTQRSQKAEKAKKGTLNIAVATNVGSLRLEPGEYEVKQVNSADRLSGLHAIPTTRTHKRVYLCINGKRSAKQRSQCRRSLPQPNTRNYWSRRTATRRSAWRSAVTGLTICSKLRSRAESQARLLFCGTRIPACAIRVSAVKARPAEPSMSVIAI